MVGHVEQYLLVAFMVLGASIMMNNISLLLLWG